MKEDFFYSKSTGLYISRKPLKIDSRVKISADKINLKINWDDEGRLNFINFDECKLILESLSSIMISPVEYWKALKDAEEEKDLDMVSELTSNNYCEWLDRIYLRDGTFIDHPKIISKYKYSGKKEKSEDCVGRPGWFNPENNINLEIGSPINVELFRDKFSSSWKYWSPDFSVTNLNGLAPIRGYVTSVGKPSFDLGIPPDAKQPMQMVRECRKIPLEPPIDISILKKAESLLEDNSLDYNKLIEFLNSYGSLFKDSKQLILCKIRDRLINLLGLAKINVISKGNKVDELDLSGSLLSGISKKFSYNDFLKFILSSENRLKSAIKENRDLVFVMGHKNPDTDTVVSSIFEAFRNSILDKSAEYIPIVQNYKIPDEVRRLIGNEISDSILLSLNKNYITAKDLGVSRWISVDQNREPEVQKYFVSIIDHHIASKIASVQDIPKTIEIIGSCTALVVQKMIGSGIYFDEKLAKILHGATLMDTENRVVHKMTKKDKLIMNYLKENSKIHDESKFYSDLMSFLLNSDDADILFGRDYKEDWGFGFAVVKIKGGFDNKGKILKKSLFNRSIKLAKDNNLKKNLPLTVLRITDYLEDNNSVNRERVYLFFNKQTKEFKKSLFDTLIKIIKFEFGKVIIKKDRDFVEFWGSGMQLSRKKTAPIFEQIVNAFNDYFYSPSNKFWIKRDFLKKSRDVIYSGNRLKLKISFDNDKRINYLTYPEAKILVKSLGFSILSLREYWLALNDAKKVKDIQMSDSLQGSNFVEFLDSVIIESGFLIEHPKLVFKNNKCNLVGKRKKVIIPSGKPGLIKPEDIDFKTGIPKKVGPPNEYGNSNLWRYWEPDSDLVIPTRSYIFLLKQPSWDGKFHIEDSFPNLGIRPCIKKLKKPKVKVSFNNNVIKLEIIKEGDRINYSWEKGEGV